MAATEAVIVGIDHVVIGVNDLDAGAAAYETLLARKSVRYERDGVATALLSTQNATVEIMAPAGAGANPERLRAALGRTGEGWLSLVFAVNDIERMHRRAERVGLNPEPISAGEAGERRWRRFRADSQRTLGLRLFFIEHEAPSGPGATSDVTALDHAVIRAADMERAAALFGARLGLDLRLDRDVGGSRLMFFRCGGMFIEVAEDREGGDRLWGLSWCVTDASSTRARLAEAGLNVSEVRVGMKPGTRVFTVRDRTCNVPTLMIEASPKTD